MDFILINPPGVPRTLQMKRTFSQHALVSSFRQRAVGGAAFRHRALTYVFQWQTAEKESRIHHKSTMGQPPNRPQQDVFGHRFKTKERITWICWTAVNQNGFSPFLVFVQSIPVLALTADIFKPRNPKQTFAVPGPGQQCSQSWRK